VTTLIAQAVLAKPNGVARHDGMRQRALRQRPDSRRVTNRRRQVLRRDA